MSESIESKIKGCTWEPYAHSYDTGKNVNGYRLSNGRGYVLPSEDGGGWCPSWANPLMYGIPGWHHPAFGLYPDAKAAISAFEVVYALEHIAGNTARCAIAASVKGQP